MEIVRWLGEHGESLLSSLGIVGGLAFTGVGLHRDSRARRIENLISLTQQHREIWAQVLDAPALARVAEPLRDIRKEPATERERLFLQSLVLYLGTVHRAVQLDELLKPHGMEQDIRDFFTRPLPHMFWLEIRRYQDPDFSDFVERNLNAISS
jgi:hypothetical protein